VALTKQLTLDGAFWINVVCIPAIKDMRKWAIRLMAKTYNEVKVVIMIDYDIRAL
jgi:hypothetical protein